MLGACLFGAVAAAAQYAEGAAFVAACAYGVEVVCGEVCGVVCAAVVASAHVAVFCAVCGYGCGSACSLGLAHDAGALWCAASCFVAFGAACAVC